MSVWWWLACAPAPIAIPGDAYELADADRDGDTILDVHEGDADPDGDGRAAAIDRDADGDGIRDIDEAGDADPSTRPVDSDGDSAPDALDADADNNGILDGDEPDRDLDGDGSLDRIDLDDDGDGLLDVHECGDVDHDSLPGPVDRDSDGDGLADADEGGADTDGDGAIDACDADADDDGRPDTEECGDPGAPDPARDTDGDGRPDCRDPDADGDGAADADEVALGWDPEVADMDGDGGLDGDEWLAGRDPTDPSDGGVLTVHLPPRGEARLDLSLALRHEAVDIGLIVETTQRMDQPLADLQRAFADVFLDVPIDTDVAVGVATFEDYAYGAYGAPGSDRPFRLRQEVTTDDAAVAATVAALRVWDGGDAPQSGFEALHQAASGAGYDQDCDGHYDAPTDVPPFSARPTDPFGGRAASAGTDPDALGGLGFRQGALPIVVWFTASPARDPASASLALRSSPQGCPGDADHDAAAAALAAIGAVPVTIVVSDDPTPLAQARALATALGAAGDLDGDGVVAGDDDLFVTASDEPSAWASFVHDVVRIAAEAHPDASTLTLEVDDPHGFVVGHAPAAWPATLVDTSVAFAVQLKDAARTSPEPQRFLLTFRVIGDGTRVVAQRPVVVVVDPI